MSGNRQRVGLSEHDRLVLENVFNPLEMTAGLPLPEHIPDEDLVDEEPDSEEVREAKRLEVAAVKAAEANEWDKSLELFEESLRIAPTRGSTFNNRAQVYRLKGKDEKAFEDLNRAIELTADKPLKKTRCHALCQRGILYRKQENLDAAREDFSAAAELGSQFARGQLVEINPYAALCNQMLRQAFDHLKS